MMNGLDSGVSSQPYWQPLQVSQSENPLASAVWQVISKIYPDSPPNERRQSTRYPFPYLIQLQPVSDVATTTRVGSPLVAVGKQISESGLGFYHPKPLPGRYSVVFLQGGGAAVAVLMELIWTRFTEHGWYESGARFLRLLEPEAEVIPSGVLPVPATP